MLLNAAFICSVVLEHPRGPATKTPHPRPEGAPQQLPGQPPLELVRLVYLEMEKWLLTWCQRLDLEA